MALYYELKKASIDFLKNDAPNMSTLSPEELGDQFLQKLREAMKDACYASGERKADLRTPPAEPTALFLLNRYDIKKISLIDDVTEETDILGVYQTDGLQKGTYQLGQSIIKRILLQYFPGSTNKTYINEVIDCLATLAEPVTLTSDKDLIPVNNGIFDRKMKTLIDFSPQYVFLSKCPVDYVPNAPNPVLNHPDGTPWDVENWMKSISDDAEIVNLLWQVIGASIRPHYRWDKGIWFFSEVGSNGKGCICELIRQLVGSGNWISLAIDLFDENFKLEPVIGKSCIITDENSVNSYIDSSKRYKAMITGDAVDINRKYKPVITMHYSGVIIQCMNGFPKCRDKSGSFYRRLLLIPFEKSFQGIERKEIKGDFLKRKEVLEYVLCRVLHMDYDEFSEPEACKKLVEEYKQYNDPTREFWFELKDEFVWDVLPNAFLYDLFKEWCRRNMPQGKISNKNTFLKELKNILKDSTEWRYVGAESTIHVGDKMLKYEPLTFEYDLDKWQYISFEERDTGKRRMIASFPEKCRGLERL